MKKPRFSVVIPTLHEEKFLPKLLTSLVSQSVKNFEVIVVDGSSTDKTIDVAKRFAKRLPLRTLISEVPGVSRQRNMGAKLARGEWLVFIDADSVLLSNFFERIALYIQRKKPKFFTTWFRGDVDDASHAIAGFLGNMSLEGAALIDRPFSPGPLTIIRKEVFMKVDGYDEQTTFGEDHDLTMKVKEKGVVMHILREVLYEYSMRRFRKEGSVKAFERYFRSFLKVAVTRRGFKNMPGFVSGGSLYDKDPKTQKADTKLFKKLEQGIKGFFEEFIAFK